MTQTENMKYDSRKKILHRTVKEKDVINLANKKAGTYDILNTQEYSVEGIKLLVGELKNQKQQIEEMLAQHNKVIESTQHLDDDDSLKELRQKLEQLELLKRKHKSQEVRDNLITDHQVVCRQLNDVLEAVGSHIKFK